MFALFALGLSLVAIAAQAQTASSPLPLSNGVAMGPLSDSSGNKRYYAFTVAPGATSASFSISGGSGDCDIYVRYGSVPTTSTWDYRPYLNGSNETVNVNNPAAGTWYVMLRAYSSYSGVTLKAQYAGGSDPAVVAAPTFSPAPGSYSGQVNVQLATTTPNAVIRYTLNGSTPTTGSEVYAAPVMVTSTTQIKAAAFATDATMSAVASGTYTITDTVRSLANNTPVSNLSGAQGSVANFKFAVPSGAASVSFSISGGSGDADLYVKYGQLATTSVWDQRPYLSGNNETVTINAPRVGDYYLMVQGYRAYSGLTIKASYSGSASVGKPDLVVSADALNPYVTTQTFSSSACELQEGTIDTAGTKKLLRFTTQTRNIGTADLVLGNPATSTMFEWGACHGHYHFRSFAQYRLLDSTGAVVRTGKKVGFCLMDITRIDSGANPSARYSCSNQGIQAGWADIYSAQLSGQWIDITGLPSGPYILEIVIDPMNLIDELDDTNNVTRANVTIP